MVKWLVIGRYRAGDYPLWGGYYFRWWLMRRFTDVLATPNIAGTPMIRTYYRLLGAKVSHCAFIGRGVIDAPDLVTNGDDGVISDNAMIATRSVERGLLRLGLVEIGARTMADDRPLSPDRPAAVEPVRVAQRPGNVDLRELGGA